MKRFDSGSWVYCSQYQQVCKIIETQNLWGDTICRVWLPNQNAVVRVREDELKPVDETGMATPAHIAYVAAAARVADALARDVILAPIESSVIPLPHQIRALLRAVANDQIRYLLADEVGLGKTIEAGLIMRELKLRGQVTRTLVVAPRGLVTQWVAEMRTHFNEDFRLLIPGDFSAYRQIIQDDNIWQRFPQIVCPIDSVKPLEGRKGWSRDQVAKYNKERFEDLISAGWDLIIVDEAHRLGGSTDQVARHKLGLALAEAAPYLLLLSATPHQGKTDSFHRLISLLDQDAFPDIESITRDRVKPYVIRTEKRQAICADGKPLFKPRRTQLEAIAWDDRHRMQRILYHAVTEYVREGYNQAMREKRNYIGFLMLLMQRLVTSSTRAVRVALERRLEVLESPEGQLSLFDDFAEDDWVELDGQEQLDLLTKHKLQAIKNEHAEVWQLLESAKECDEAGPDVKAEALMDWIYRLQQEEKDPNLKILIFTEFMATQEMLYEFLTSRGFQAVCLNGSMNMQERDRVQEEFADRARILISTDAGGEGLNFQFCHVVVNYDIPWNPMRLEQRIGRVDRIGQNKVVRAINLVLEDSVDHRILEVLEEKLAVIFNEFGVDKTGDVLDSAQAAGIFEDLYLDAILNPEEMETSIANAVTRIETQVRQTKESISVLGSTEDLTPDEAERLISHPFPYWVERMTTSFVQAHGGQVERRIDGWNLRWPDSSETIDVIFTGKEAELNPTAQHLTLQNANIRNLIMRLPHFVPGQPIPVIELPNIPQGVSGFWSLWEISVQADDWNRKRIISLFLHDDGRILVPTARRIWDELLSESIKVEGHVKQDSNLVFQRLMEAVKTYGRTTYDELTGAHEDRMKREREKGNYSFDARQRAIERIGLPAVRNYRLRQLEQEKHEWQKMMEQKAQVSPDVVPLVIVRIEEGASHD
jgi:superfamily II DNA or RNA helicase